MGFSANLLAIKGEFPLGTKGTLLLPIVSKENLCSMINSTTESISNHILSFDQSGHSVLRILSTDSAKK